MSEFLYFMCLYILEHNLVIHVSLQYGVHDNVTVIYLVTTDVAITTTAIWPPQLKVGFSNPREYIVNTCEYHYSYRML